MDLAMRIKKDLKDQVKLKAVQREVTDPLQTRNSEAQVVERLAEAARDDEDSKRIFVETMEIVNELRE